MSLRVGLVLKNIAASCYDRLKTEVHLFQLMVRFPTLTITRPSYWRFDTLRAIEVHGRVYVAPFCEVIAYQKSPRSRVPGRLVLHDGVVIQAGSNIRAAGGTIEIGRDSAISQSCVVVAANHTLPAGKRFLPAPWDETRTGVIIGENVWIGAGSQLLPGIEIGDNAVIAAGSVVNRSIPAGEIWGGVPAQFIKKVRADP